MTAQFRFYIAIGFFAVIGQTSSSMCYNITRSVKIRGRVRNTIGIEKPIFNLTDFYGRKDYSTDFLSCSDCVNDSQICICNRGWTGESCEESIFCYIASEASEVPPVKNTENVAANPNEQWRGFLRECQPDCLGQINYTFPISTRIANTNYYLINKKLKCNIIAAMSHQTSQKMSIISGVAILIIILLLIMVVAAVCTVIRKRRTRRMVKHEPTEPISNDVGLRPMSNTYDDILPPTPNYDDVIVPPNRVYDEVFLVPNYDDVSVQPIRVYDDVNVGSNCVYDYVNVVPILEPWCRSNPQMTTMQTSSTMKKS